MSITILLADDHELMREGLRSVLEEDFHFSVVGQAGNGSDALSLAQRLQPDVVIIDVHMPVLNGIDATRELRRNCEHTKVIALSMERERQFVSDMFRAGAHAYVIKHSALDELESAVHTVLTGRRYLSSDITDVVIDDYIRHLDAVAPAADAILTPKERQVLQLISEGHTTREIADILFVSVSTIETHRNHLFSKLGVKSVADLTKIAIRMGLTEL